MGPDATDAGTCPFRLPLIAILRGIRPEQVLVHVAALVEEGYDAIEIPINSPEWERSIAAAVHGFGADAWIGGGTVLHAYQVESLQALGVRFIVTPNTEPAVITRAVQYRLPVIAGFATPTEAFAAIAAGASMLKLFPASVYGPSLVRALRAVLPSPPFFAVGGVTPTALPALLSAGCTGAGIGSELYQPGQPVETTRDNARAFRRALLDATA